MEIHLYNAPSIVQRASTRWIFGSKTWAWPISWDFTHNVFRQPLHKVTDRINYLREIWSLPCLKLLKAFFRKIKLYFSPRAYKVIICSDLRGQPHHLPHSLSCVLLSRYPRGLLDIPYNPCAIPPFTYLCSSLFLPLIFPSAISQL